VKGTAAVAAVVVAAAVANYPTTEEEEVEEENFYSYINLVHYQSFLPYAEKPP
jgi:hypothetical protein